MPTAQVDVAHLLRRAGFGGTNAEITKLATLDRAAIVDSLLNALQPSIDPPPEVRMVGQDKWKAYEPLTLWWLNRMATSPAPLIEKMTLFWHGHFVSSLEKSELMPMWEQHLLFRNKGLGSFGELVHNVAFGAAMLDYLDNRDNTADERNENFARELMELFTLGKGNYTQADVVASARAWTGHNMDEPRLNYKYFPDKHDNGTKKFLGVTKNWDGPDIVAALCGGQPGFVTAKRIARKLWEFFAYPEPEEALLTALTADFTKSNLDVKTLLRSIFMRDEFYNEKSKRGHVRSPVEFAVAAARYSGIPIKALEPQWRMESMGQQLWFPPNVAGWPGDKAWITNSAMWAKGNFARSLTWQKGYESLLKQGETMQARDAAKLALGTFGIDIASSATVDAIEAAVNAERAAKGWGERNTLIVMSVMSPEFQVA